MPRLLILAALLVAAPAVAAEPTSEQIEFFEKHVRPVFAENCFDCHGPDVQEAGLRLDSRDAILKGGETGPAVVPGNPGQSELILALSYDPDGYQMPPDGKLADEQIAAVTEWVRMGAPWPGRRDAPAAEGGDAGFDLPARAKHWSFQPVRRPAIPDVSQPAWPRTPVDAFILNRLDAAGLSPAAEADRRTLLRRATYDLIGLPPTADELDAFVSDPSPDAYEKVVDRLLASPRYGERWARHWLDLVRFAETTGHEFD
jgi:mono/diheme cytochrome c family protein